MAVGENENGRPSQNVLSSVWFLQFVSEEGAFKVGSKRERVLLRHGFPCVHSIASSPKVLLTSS